MAAFLAAALLVALALFAYAQLATVTLLECDRASDACVLSEVKPYWKDELDRFPVAKLREARHFQLAPLAAGVFLLRRVPRAR